MPENQDKQSDQLPGDELDRLLMQAQWADPSGESTQRLSRQWMRLCGQSSLPIWRPFLAVAASAGMVFFGAWMYRHMEAKPVPTIAGPIASIATVKAEPADIGRPATNIELAMLRVMNARMRSAGSTTICAPSGLPLVPVVTGWTVQKISVQAQVPPSPPPVDANVLARRAKNARDVRQRDLLLDEMVTLGPPGSAQPMLNLLAQSEMAPSAIAALTRHPQGWSDVLFSALNDSRVSVRSSAAQALAQIDGPVITARLISMSDADINRREAVTALVRIHSADARKYVEAAKQSSELGAIVRSAIAQNVTVATRNGAFQ